MYPARIANLLQSSKVTRNTWLILHQAMEMILTGAPATANEMQRLGVVNRIMAADQDVLQEAVKVARRLASFSAPVVGMAKHAVTVGKSSLDNDLPGTNRSDGCSGSDDAKCWG